jgi:endonuclease/exonuclease/phosphatase family metal-dependent hydrolase
MLVSIPGAVAVSPTAHFGANEEIWVLANGGAGATGLTERGGIAVSAGDFNPERIQIDDLDSATLLPEVDVGARFADMTGVVNYNFGNYEVLLPAAPQVTEASTLQREVTTLSGSAGALTVGTFNVENLDPGDTSFAAIAAAITGNLGAPDILCVEEIQDNSGPTNNGVVDASVTFQTLIDAIVAAGGPRYEFRQIDPVDGQDGGEPGGNIRTGFLFNPDRVDFVEGSLARLEDPVGGAFDNSRKPLVGVFSFNGEAITVIGNHFNSKGGDQPLYGVTQPPVLNSEAQRMKQATIVADYVDGLLADDAGASVIVLGDLNDFEFSAPVGVLEAAGLTSLVETLPANQRYSYNFEGNAQVLDHIMVSPGLLAATTGFDIVHINSEFSDQLSDHDPSVARFGIAEQKVLVGRFGADTLVGGDGHDTLTGLQGRDLLIGGDGDDRFVYTSMLDLNDLILDFEPGADTVVVGALLASIGYAGDDPLADGTLGLMERAGRTYATIDRDGSAGHAAPRVIAELVGVALDELAGVTIFDAGASA